MSTYEYKCQDCGYQFEKILPIHEHDKYKPQCPKCKSKKVEQMISSFFAKTNSKT
jgi:putative FmdB family regulatory protein